MRIISSSKNCLRFNHFSCSTFTSSWAGLAKISCLIFSIDLSIPLICSSVLICFCSTLANESCRSEEHTSELQSRGHLVCRLLLENKQTYKMHKLVGIG